MGVIVRGVIVREWRGRAAPGKAGAYPQHFRDKVLPALRGVDGFLGARLLRRRLPDAAPDGGTDGGTVEYTVLTRWSSLDAIRAFAGDDIERAVVEPEAQAALADYDRTVRHYEVLQETSAAG
jgi:heme-degrading monooxygenase HmoA